jgi:hypothetical protein
MTAGGISGVITWFASYPFDTLKTIIQGEKRKMRQLEAYRLVMKQSGMAGLFLGLKPALIRAYFSNAIIFYTNDLCHYYLD